MFRAPVLVHRLGLGFWPRLNISTHHQRHTITLNGITPYRRQPDKLQGDVLLVEQDLTLVFQQSTLLRVLII